MWSRNGWEEKGFLSTKTTTKKAVQKGEEKKSQSIKWKRKSGFNYGLTLFFQNQSSFLLSTLFTFKLWNTVLVTSGSCMLCVVETCSKKIITTFEFSSWQKKTGLGHWFEMKKRNRNFYDVIFTTFIFSRAVEKKTYSILSRAKRIIEHSFGVLFPLKNFKSEHFCFIHQIRFIFGSASVWKANNDIRREKRRAGCGWTSSP